MAATAAEVRTEPNGLRYDDERALGRLLEETGPWRLGVPNRSGQPTP